MLITPLHVDISDNTGAAWKTCTPQLNGTRYQKEHVPDVAGVRKAGRAGPGVLRSAKVNRDALWRVPSEQVQRRVTLADMSLRRSMTAAKHMATKTYGRVETTRL